MDKAQENILRDALWTAYCEGRANNKYIPDEVLPRLLAELGYHKITGRPELEEVLKKKITHLAVGMMIITGKLKIEDLGEEDKNRFEEICQLTFDQILALLPDEITGKPPLLSNQQMHDCVGGVYDLSHDKVAQAQWNICDKFYEEE